VLRPAAQPESARLGPAFDVIADGLAIQDLGFNSSRSIAWQQLLLLHFCLQLS
jgi:hypothetical protein